MFECHGHIILNGFSYNEALAMHNGGVSEKSVRVNLNACAVAGVTFYRDGGDNKGVSVFAKAIAPEYGIDYRTPAFMIHKKGLYGGMFGKAFSSTEDVPRLIKTAAEQNADFIKIAVTGFLDFSDSGGYSGEALSLAEIRSIVKASSDEGLSVMAHVNGAQNIKNALIAGVKSIEHGFFTEEDAFPLFTEHNAVWVPTCSAVENFIGTGRFDDAILKSIMSQHKKRIQKAAQHGVLIAAGSDAGAAYVPQGTGTRCEHDILKAIGVDASPGNLEIQKTFKRKSLSRTAEHE